jgi:hypothetical protein
MKRCLLYFSRKVLFVSMMLMLFASLHSKAQTDITIGTGTVGNDSVSYPCPLQDWYEGSKMQYLYRASELNAAGMGAGTINAIKYNVLALYSSTNPFPAVEQLTIKIGTTTNTSLSNSVWETGLTTVYGPVDYTTVLGMNTFNFNTPFVWNGSDNIVIEICNGDPNNSSGIYYTRNPTIAWTTGLSFNGSHTYRLDNNGNLCGAADNADNSLGLQTTRPNITFNWTIAAACSGTPNAGTATTTASTLICAGASFTLDLTGSTQASGLSYQWQSSPDSITWTNISGANTRSYTTTQSQALQYYRCVVTCNNSAVSSNSSVVKVTNNPQPAYSTLPITESFESVWLNGCSTREIPNLNWRNLPVVSDSSWRREDDGVSGLWTTNSGGYSPSASAGLHSARFHTYDAPNGNSGSLYLYVNCNTAVAGKKLLFDFINTGGTDSLSILISTDGGTTYTRVDSAGNATTWRTKTVLFTSQSATTVIRFKATSDYGLSDIGIDNISVADNIVTGISDVQNVSSNVRLYPNPASNKVYVEYPERSFDQISLYDVSGKLLRIWTVARFSSMFSFDIDLQPGIYMIQLNGKGKVATHKLIVR